MIILVVSNANNIGFVCALSNNALQTLFVIVSAPTLGLARALCEGLIQQWSQRVYHSV